MFISVVVGRFVSVQSFPGVDSNVVFELRHPGVPTMFFRAENSQSRDR